MNERTIDISNKVIIVPAVRALLEAYDKYILLGLGVPEKVIMNEEQFDDYAVDLK